jgi:predicted metal-dependent HD superfamily phosphohydrolase
MAEFGLDPKCKWDGLIYLSKKLHNIEFDPDFTDLFYDLILVPAYTENRHYHTLRHVEYMLHHVNDFIGIGRFNSNLLKWAIWFHDIIYDSKRTDNEKRSAKALADFSRVIGIDEESIKIMEWLIILTSHKGQPQTRLEDIICDLDLREFVSDRSHLNAEEVRKEFGHVADKEFYEGRIDFINSMLAKEFIYHTDEYRDTLEDTARHNLRKELDTIKQQLNG